MSLCHNLIVGKCGRMCNSSPG